MSEETLFCNLSSDRMADLILAAKRSVCFAGPGIQQKPAKALVKAAGRLGSEMITVCLDFDERVMRMGYGDIAAVECVKKAGVVVHNSPGLRSAFVIIDDQGFIFTPTALYLEAEGVEGSAPNAMRLTRHQIAEVQARLSPTGKAIAQLLATTTEEKERIASLPLEVETEPVSQELFNQVEEGLKQAPPVKFDVARQVRVFEPYLQYVELSLTGAAIQRHRMTIPPSIQKLGGSTDLEGRLRTTFDLIERNSKLSSKALEKALNEIRNNLTKSLGKNHGRVVLKRAKPHLENRLKEFRDRLDKHRDSIEKDLQEHLDASRKQVVDYYLPIAEKSPPDALIGQLFVETITKENIESWLNSELDRVFPSAEDLVQEMKLEDRFKDVTFETLNHPDFLDSVKKAFPKVDWDKAYNDFKAASEHKGVVKE